MQEHDWLKHQDREYFNSTEREVADFARVYEDVGLSPQDFSGTVLSAGVGPIIPERAFICSPESKYKVLHPWVKKVVLCDMDYYQRFKILQEPIIPQILYEDSQQQIASGKIVSIQSSLWELLDLISLSYDAITLCRVPELPDQLSVQNLLLLTTKLNHGGIALLSGSFRWDDNTLEGATQTLNRISGVEATLHELPSGGSPLNLGFDGHYGIVIRKN